MAIAASKREQILAAVVTILEGIEAGDGKPYNYSVETVTRRIKQLSEVKRFPHINIFAGPSNKKYETNITVHDEFMIGVQAIIAGTRTPADPDAFATDVEKMIHDIDTAMLADITLGLPAFVEMVTPNIVDPVTIWHELKAVIDMTYTVSYFYSIGDP